ncbi:hypothetical protein BaRGS_00026203 [Batillaria attramentaria]|uniref:Uncharacterized protein n=1 Tax=Batillaria attramentaria TaxID=370345 RepID=A0ABD0K589_9CAEN
MRPTSHGGYRLMDSSVLGVTAVHASVELKTDDKVQKTDCYREDAEPEMSSKRRKNTWLKLCSQYNQPHKCGGGQTSSFSDLQPEPYSTPAAAVLAQWISNIIHHHGGKSVYAGTPAQRPSTLRNWQPVHVTLTTSAGLSKAFAKEQQTLPSLRPRLPVETPKHCTHQSTNVHTRSLRLQAQ